MCFCGHVACRSQEAVDSALLSKLDSLMFIMEREQAIRNVISQFEEEKQKEEDRAFNMNSFSPIMQGLILSRTERHFIKHEGKMEESSGKVNLMDYGVAGAPLVATWALKAAGVKSRSKIERLATANALSFAIGCGATELLKMSVKERRPDGSDNHSLPSGHTTVAFASASILAREYGYISPWITVGGFATATGTQYLRIQHDKHWMNDLYIGAGIGMMATNLGYYLTDRILKNEDLKNKPEVRLKDLQRVLKFNELPSGLSFVSGTEVGSRTFHLDDIPVKTFASFTAGVEGTWFLNKNYALELITRCTTGYAKVYNERVPSLADDVFSGDNVSIYHVNIGGKYSLPITLDKRINTRVHVGIRHMDGMNFQSESAETIAVMAENKFELGCGIGCMAIDKENYAVGFSCDYYHTFSDFLPNRFNLSSVWKILF